MLTRPTVSPRISPRIPPALRSPHAETTGPAGAAESTSLYNTPHCRVNPTRHRWRWERWPRTACTPGGRFRLGIRPSDDPTTNRAQRAARDRRLRSLALRGSGFGPAHAMQMGRTEPNAAQRTRAVGRRSGPRRDNPSGRERQRAASASAVRASADRAGAKRVVDQCRSMCQLRVGHRLPRDKGPATSPRIGANR